MDWFELVERDHEIQNPISAEKIGSWARPSASARRAECSTWPAARAGRPGSSPTRSGAVSSASSCAQRGPTVERFERSGVTLTGIVAASEDDWDRYESPHWRAVKEWLAANPGHEDAGAVVARHARDRGEYLSFRRELLGWAVFVGRRSAPLPARDET